MIQHATGPDRAQSRINTGALQFPGDWAGIFIRGDEIAPIAWAIRRFLEDIPKSYISARKPLEEFLKAYDEAFRLCTK